MRTKSQIKQSQERERLSSLALQLGVDLRPSQTSGEVAGPPQALKFEEQRFPHFEVEYADRGDDIVYHFWPPNGGDSFVANFAHFLEEAYRAVLPHSADVRANHLSRHEVLVLATHSDLVLEQITRPGQPWYPRETYSVCVMGGRNYPLSEMFLKNKVFRNIEENIERGS